MPPKHKRASMVGTNWEHIPDEEVAEEHTHSVKTESIDDASMSTPELRDLRTQVREQREQLDRLKEFQKHIDNENRKLRDRLQKVEDGRKELEGTVLSQGESTVTKRGSEGLGQRIFTSIERFPGEDGEDNSWILSNGSHTILVDCVASVERAQQLATSLLERPEELFCIFLTRAPAPRTETDKSGESLKLLRTLLTTAPIIVGSQEIKSDIFKMCSLKAEVLKPGGNVTLPSGGVITTLKCEHTVNSNFGRHVASVWIASEKVLLCGDLVRNDVHARISPPTSLGRLTTRWLESWMDEIDGVSEVVGGVLGGLEGVRIAPGAGDRGDAESLLSAMKLYLQTFVDQTNEITATPDYIVSAMKRLYPTYTAGDKLLAISTSHIGRAAPEDLDDEGNEEEVRQQQGLVKQLSLRMSSAGGGHSSNEEWVRMTEMTVGVLHFGWPCEMVTDSGRLRKRVIKLRKKEEKYVLEWPPRNAMSLMTLGTSSVEFMVELSRNAAVKVGNESTRSAEKGKMVTIVGDDRKEYEFKMRSKDDAKAFIRGVSAVIQMDQQTLSRIIQQNPHK